MRELALKRQYVQPVLDSLLDELAAYLDTSNGSIFFVTHEARSIQRRLIPQPTTLEDAAALLQQVDDLEGWEREDVLKVVKTILEPTVYPKIPKENIDQAFDDMLAFIATVVDDNLRGRLLMDTEQDWPLNRFQKTLDRHAEERQRWFRFREKARLKRFILWLAEQGFYPEWT